MFSLLSGAYREWTRREVYNILILGLDNAGKTTLLEQLKRKPGHDGAEDGAGRAVGMSPPTIGMNTATIDVGGQRVRLWDLGGATELHSIWRSYYADCHGVVFVIDGREAPSLRGDACGAPATLARVCEEASLEGVPVLLLINKADGVACAPAGGEDDERAALIVAVKEAFNPIVERIGARECKVHTCSAIERINIDGPFAWLVEKAVGNRECRPASSD